MPVTLPILHFNDVYRVRQKDKSLGGTIGADQFAFKIASIRSSWGEPSTLSNLPPPASADWAPHSTARERKGLVLFSGDLYSPSVESSVTRGTHLIPVINAMNLDCACLGNHDWDFGYPHLQTLMSQNNFPWLFTNVVNTQGKKDGGVGSWDEDLQDSDGQVAGTLRYWTTTVQGVKVGCIGIVEKEWIATVPSFPDGFLYRNMAKTALKLSEKLRDPNGEACELIIALTHSRLPNDIDFANEVGAVADADRAKHGVDLVLGGHDHIYYVGNGCDSYTGQDYPKGEPGTEKDTSAMVVKSGTDFRDLSELTLTLSDPDPSAIRKRTIQSLSVKRYRTAPSDPTKPELKTMLDELLAKISKSTSQSVAYTLTPWDVRSEKVRTAESAFGNFVADVLMNSYEEVLRERDNRGELSESRPANAREVDCAIICGGSLRGDQVYGPGKVALSDVLEILPFEDAVVCKELKGQDVWDALENGLSMYPKQEGRFPQVAGMMVKWDSRKPPGNRLVSVELLDNPLDSPSPMADDNSMDVDTSEPDVGKLRRFSVTKLPGGGYDLEVNHPALVSRGPLEMDKTYRVVTREYLAEGYDGFEALRRGTFVVDHENGQLMSAIVRKFLLGASYLWRMKQVRRLQEQREAAENEAGSATAKEEGEKTLSKRTRIAITRARSLNLLKRAMKHKHDKDEPATPVRKPSRDRAGSLGSGGEGEEGELWRMVVDQSPGGFRDALHVGGSEHHSAFDSVSRRFNQPLAREEDGSVAETSSHAATRSYTTDRDTMGIPAAKRLRTAAEDEGVDSKDVVVDNALFDPTLASGLQTQIRQLLALVAQAANPDGHLYAPTLSSTDSRPTEQEEDGGGTGAGANIALGSMAVDDGDNDATLAFLNPSGASATRSRGTPTQLSREIIQRATELRTSFTKLEEAAKTLPGGTEMGLKEQEKLLSTLEAFIQHQNASLAPLATPAPAAAALQNVASSSFQHGAIASSSFHLDQQQMDQLRQDIKASSNTAVPTVKSKHDKDDTDDDTSNLAFVSPLVDGRLVDIARQK